MPNDPVRANARPMPTDRRAVLRSLASAGALGAVAVAPAAAAATPAPLSVADQRALDLWARRQRAKRICDEREAASAAAASKLPEWARPGPKYLRRDGSPFGEDMSPSPMVVDLRRRPLMPGSIVDARPSAEDLYAEWRRADEAEVRRSVESDDGFAETGAALSEFVRALAEHEGRLRQMRAEHERLGTYGLDNALEAAFRVRSAVELQLEKLIDFSDLAAAAMLIVEIGYDNGEDVPGLQRAALRALRPRLVGAIAEDADRVLSLPAHSQWEQDENETSERV